MRVSNATTATRPTRLRPQIEAAHHHLGRIGKAVVQAGNATRLEPARPVRFFQLPSQAQLAFGESSRREETILEVTSEHRPILQVLGRLSLGVQQRLYTLDNGIAMAQEEVEQLDVCVKR